MQWVLRTVRDENKSDACRYIVVWCLLFLGLQYFVSVGWAAGRAAGWLNDGVLVLLSASIEVQLIYMYPVVWHFLLLPVDLIYKPLSWFEILHNCIFMTCSYEIALMCYSHWHVLNFGQSECVKRALCFLYYKKLILSFMYCYIFW